MPKARMLVLAAMTLSLLACGGQEKKPAETSRSSRAARTGAGEVPPFLKGTAWPPAVRIPFEVAAISSQGKVVISSPNVLDYSFPAVKAGEKSDAKLHSTYKECPRFPCVPESFTSSHGLPLPCDFYIFRDPSRRGRYMSYVYSETWQQYALMVDGLGPMHPDFLERYYRVNPMKPTKEPPKNAQVPVGNPPDGRHILWFRATGFGGYPATEDLFAVHNDPVKSPEGAYRPPYAFAGKRSELVYRTWDTSPDFKPDTFQPPAGYKRVTPQPVQWQLTSKVTINLDCPVRFPFDLYDHPVVIEKGSLEPIRGTVMVCAACHTADVLEDSRSQPER